MILKITALAALNIENIINQKHGTLREMRVLTDILEKVEIPADLKERVTQQVGDKIIFDMRALAVEQPLEVTLEKAEARALKDLLESTDLLRPVDLKNWCLEVLDQLKDVR